MARPLLEKILKGDRVAVSKAISLVENKESSSQNLMKDIYPHTGRAFIIGVTGPPGTGKSSLVDRLTKLFRLKGNKIGVLAIDPTSPLSGGAILGDRVRMLDLALDQGVYIRSMASRGDEGGLSRAARNAIRILDAAGNDIVLVETVGTGQAEVEIVSVADVVLVVLMPELGDEIQAAKAGLMEIGDIFVVNKADLPGTERVLLNLHPILTSRNGWTQIALRTSARSGSGLEELVSRIEEFKRFKGLSTESISRKFSNLSAEVLRNLSYEIFNLVSKEIQIDKKLFDELVTKALNREMDPESVTQLLLERYFPDHAPRKFHDDDEPQERRVKRLEKL